MSLLLLYVLIVSLIFISHAILFSLPGLSSIVSLLFSDTLDLLLLLLQGSHLVVAKCSTLKPSSCTPQTVPIFCLALLTISRSDLNAYINNVASIHPSLLDPLLLLPSLPKLKKSRKHELTPNHKRTFPSLSTVRFSNPFTCVTQRRFLLFPSFRR